MQKYGRIARMAEKTALALFLIVPAGIIALSSGGDGAAIFAHALLPALALAIFYRWAGKRRAGVEVGETHISLRSGVFVPLETRFGRGDVILLRSEKRDVLSWKRSFGRRCWWWPDVVEEYRFLFVLRGGAELQSAWTRMTEEKFAEIKSRARLKGAKRRAAELKEPANVEVRLRSRAFWLDIAVAALILLCWLTA